MLSKVISSITHTTEPRPHSRPDSLRGYLCHTVLGAGVRQVVAQHGGDVCEGPVAGDYQRHVTLRAQSADSHLQEGGGLVVTQGRIVGGGNGAPVAGSFCAAVQWWVESHYPHNCAAVLWAQWNIVLAGSTVHEEAPRWKNMRVTDQKIMNLLVPYTILQFRQDRGANTTLGWNGFEHNRLYPV